LFPEQDGVSLDYRGSGSKTPENPAHGLRADQGSRLASRILKDLAPDAIAC
jgi:hypothetical protein